LGFDERSDVGEVREFFLEGALYGEKSISVEERGRRIMEEDAPAKASTTKTPRDAPAHTQTQQT
jgi:hypothetical protein